jgi:hypothetical protein
MLENGIIEGSTSPWSAPAILVPRKSLDGKPIYRLCVDFRALNTVMQYDTPLPVFEESFDASREQVFFCHRLQHRVLADSYSRGS